MIRVGSLVAAIAAWTVGAAAAVSVGVLALSLIGDGLTGNGSAGASDIAINQSDPTVRASTTPPPPTTVSPRAVGGTAPAGNRTITSTGGNVVARCDSDGPYLVSWSPAPGYRTDDVVRGPATRARVTFEGSQREIKITVTCVDGSPEPSIGDEGSDD